MGGEYAEERQHARINQNVLIPNGQGKKIRQIILSPWHWIAEQWWIHDLVNVEWTLWLLVDAVHWKAAAQTEEFIIHSHFITDCFQKDKAAQKCIICGLTQKSHFAFYLLTRKRWEWEEGCEIKSAAFATFWRSVDPPANRCKQLTFGWKSAGLSSAAEN